MTIIEMLTSLENNGGFTLKNYRSVSYKTGYQVALYGVECTDAISAAAAINEYNGNCGVWYSNGIYYVDYSIRIDTKTAAIAVGKQCNQISILKWHDFSLIYC